MTTKSVLQNLVAAFAVGSLFMAGQVRADDVKVPETAADHEALAKSYQEKAASYRKEGELHKSMAAAYAKSHPDSKGGAKNAWNTKMQKHCQQLASDAEKLAKDAEKAAEFHTLRGKETEGK
jgi:hypothetical protein